MLYIIVIYNYRDKIPKIQFTHTHIYIYTHTYTCVCVCFYSLRSNYQATYIHTDIYAQVDSVSMASHHSPDQQRPFKEGLGVVRQQTQEERVSSQDLAIGALMSLF